MEQLLSAFGVDWHVLLAQAVNFAIVLVALTYLLYKPVFGMLTKRQELVAKGVEDAKKASDMLSGADGEVSQRITTATHEAEAIVERARDAANTEKTRVLKESEARAVAIESDAQARAKEVSARALQDSEREIARLSILAAEKLLQKKHD